MGKASSAKQDGDRRARIAAQRAAQQRAQRRNRLLLAGGAIVVVVAVVLALVLLQGGNSGSSDRGGRAARPDRRQPHRAHRPGHLGARRDARPGGRRHGDRAAVHASAAPR